MPAWPMPQNSAQTPLVAPRRVGLQAQDVHAPRDRVDLAGEARDPEGVDDVAAGHHDVDGRAGGKDASRPVVDHAAMVRIAEGPAPSFGMDLDPRRLRCPAAAAAVSPATSAVGHQRHQHHGRQGPARRARSSAAAPPRAPAGPQERPARTGPSPARTARSSRPASPTTAWRSTPPRARRVERRQRPGCSRHSTPAREPPPLGCARAGCYDPRRRVSIAREAPRHGEVREHEAAMPPRLRAPWCWRC